MSRVVLTDEEKKLYFKKFLEALEYAYKTNRLADFILDFYSDAEVASAIKRLEVFKRLHSGHSYARLNKELSVSPITASKVSSALKNASESFKQLLEELSQDVAPSKTTQEARPSTVSDKRSTYLG